MPRIDPQQLLSCLNPLLASNGGIRSSAEVIRLASLMEKYSKKLVSKCIYIQILKCTETELLAQFMAAGGWNLVHFWLKDGVDSSNWPLVQEILEMLLLCPVDGNRLKSNHTPKIVKNLSLNCVQNSVRILSNKLVEQWLKIAHQEKQQLQASPGQQNGTVNGMITNNNNLNVDNDKKMLVDETLKEKVNELQKDQVDSNDVSKKSSENTIKYKISNKDTGLVLSIKRSISPLIDEKEKVLKSPDVKVKSESKSKSSSSSSSDKEKKKSSSSSSHKSSSSKSSHRDKDKSSSHKSSSSSSSSNKDKHRSSSSSSSSKHSSSRDKDKDKHRDRDKQKKDIEKEQAEKDKETLSLIAPQLTHKLQRIPKRQHSDSTENKDTNDLEPSPKAQKTSTEPIERKKPSISIEVRKGDKPKTVKTLNSQFRNHGLAEEPPPPPSRKALTKKTPSTTATPTISVHTSSISTLKSSASLSPINKKIEKALESEVPERAGGVKLIKPKPMLVESTGFLDALDATMHTKKESKKRKRIPSTSKHEPESPKIETKPLKFYKDTLEEHGDDEKQNGTNSPSKEIESASEAIKENDESSKISSPKEEKELDIKEEEKRPPGIGTGPDGPPGVLVDPSRRRRAKRPIKWKPDTELTDVRYFELDENERVNVTKTFTEQKLMEHHAERNAFMLSRKLHSDDIMVEQISWRKLILVDNVPQINHGCKSREIDVQLEREKNTLQELFYHQSDSPKEPDFEHFEPSDPIHIPLDDVTGNPDAVNNFRDIAWPAPKPEIATLSSSNAFGGLFNNLGATLTIPAAPIIANPTVVNPLAAIPNLGAIASPWQHGIIPAVPPVPFLQTPPPMIQNNYQSNQPSNFQVNRNNFNGNNMDKNRGNVSGGSNWVRGNAQQQQMRRGTCFQYQKTGFCRKRNNGCPYIHER